MKNKFLKSALLACVGLGVPIPFAFAQALTTLHSFTALSDGTSGTNNDGAFPRTGLTLSGDILYGTTVYGGSGGVGTVFAVNTNDTAFTILHSFTPLPCCPYSSNSDGAFPWGGLILAGGTLYGTAWQGGGSGSGAVFTLKTNGTGFGLLYSFTPTWGAFPDCTNSDGAYPHGLLLSSNTLYGTAAYCGSSASGTVFKIKTNGTDFVTLHTFSARISGTNSDGAYPQAGLVLSGNTLYGTASVGGSSGNGTVFAVNTDGTGFTNLYSFSGGNDGGVPQDGLVLSGNTLYGMTTTRSGSLNGTVFAIEADGTSFRTLYSFSGGSDGGNPWGGLILAGKTLYGTTVYGGNYGAGTVFAIGTEGTGFHSIFSFSGLSDGSGPEGGLILSDSTLYGTTTGYGFSGRLGNGTLFSLIIPPHLTISPAGESVILTWPTNIAGFTLQSTTRLVPQAVWTTVFPSPVVANGENAVTNLVSGTEQFYRLSR